MDAHAIRIQLDPIAHSAALQWALCTDAPAQLADVFALGHTVYASGLRDYFQGVHQADQWQVNALKGQLAALEGAQAQIVDAKVKATLDQSASKLAYYKERYETLQAGVRAQLEEERASAARYAQAELARTSAELERARAELQAWAEAARGRDVAALKQEIALLKSTNHVKGRQGELAIKDLLQEHFTEWAIEYTGSTAHECDLHMTSGQTKIMIESKNKDSITRGDVDKFYRDIHESYSTAKPATAGVFVSIHSRNIPGKGHMCLEQVDTNQKQKAWAIFLGFSDEEEMKLLLRPYMMLFVSTIRACPLNKEPGSGPGPESLDQESAAARALDAKIMALFADIALDAKSLAALKSHVALLAKTAADAAVPVGELEARHLARCADWREWLKAHGHAEQQHISVVERAPAYSCHTCKAGFTNKKAHAKHVKECV
jgi:ketosteroid isomerase-like protein